MPPAPVVSEETPSEFLSLSQRLVIAGAVVASAVCWFLAGNELPVRIWIVALAALALSMIPPVTRTLGLLLRRLRHPSPRTREWTGLIIGVVATGYLTSTAFLQGRSLSPRMVDESSYVISSQLLAHGRLWLPQHPLADFFDSFFLTVRPKYSSIYFPGTGLAFAPAAWFGWASWILPVVLSGICVALLYRIVTAMTKDGAAGLLAALWMTSLRPFRGMSVMVMSHIVMLLLGLLLVSAWLRWRDSRRKWLWTLLIGAVAGWAAITRPVDALAFAVPVGIAMAIALLRHPARIWAATALLLVIGASPFLALQVTHNIGITGNPLQTPYTAYLLREQPGAQFGIRTYNPAWQPESSSRQMKDYYDWCRTYLERHQPNNFWRQWLTEQKWPGNQTKRANLLTVIDATMPGRMLMPLLFAGCIAVVISRRRLVRSAAIPLAAVLPLFLFLYVFNPFFLTHYLVAVTPCVILLALLGAHAVAQAAGDRWAERVRVITTTAIVILSLTSLWEVRWVLSPDHKARLDGFENSLPQAQVDALISVTVQPPAVVLFSTAPDVWSEMVYNVDVASPDDAPIIRAHDLGPRNGEIFNYYGETQPDRVFYRFNWRNGSLNRLGEAGTLRVRLRKGVTVETIMNGAEKGP